MAERMVEANGIDICTEDFGDPGDIPILPHPHGEATVEAIEGARMVTLDRVGHEIPEVVWPQVTEAILAHTAE